MPSNIQFKLLSEKDTEAELGKVKRISVDFPKKGLAKTDFTVKLKSFQGGQPVAIPTVKEIKVTGIKLRAADVAKLRAVNESLSPTAEAIVNQKLGPNELLGVTYSSLAALEFINLMAERKKRSSNATTPAAKAKVEQEWAEVVKAGKQAFSATGVKGLTEADLLNQAKELQSSKANFNTVVNIANSGVPSNAAKIAVLTGASAITGAFIPVTGILRDAGVVGTVINDLCSRPFAEGVFTKSFSRSFNFTIRLRVWCPTWTNPFRTCMKTFTIAGASFSLSVNVGYRVSCCGATAWGQASAQACGTLVGITICAGCTASITGVAGIGRTTSGGDCIYGLGINAQLKCKFGGITVFQVQAPFGFNVKGPCPPAGLC